MTEDTTAPQDTTSEDAAGIAPEQAAAGDDRVKTLEENLANAQQEVLYARA